MPSADVLPQAMIVTVLAGLRRLHLPRRAKSVHVCLVGGGWCRNTLSSAKR
jgi:hypothetical protein